jgi:hypothetical protein
MDAHDPITAAAFSAYLKCPTKAHLLVIDEPAPAAFFADIEARISSMYKAAAKRRLCVGTAAAELLDFAQIWSSLDKASTHHIDCETPVYDLAPQSHRPGGGPPQDSSPSGTLDPVLFSPWDKPELSDNLLLCFGALALSQATGILAVSGRLIYGEGHRSRTVRIGDHVARTRQIIDAMETVPSRPEQALRRLRLPDEVPRPCYRTRRFKLAQRDDCQGAGKMQCEGNLLDNAAFVRLPPATAQAQS